MLNRSAYSPQGKAWEAVHILYAGERGKPADPVPAPSLDTAERFDGYRIMDLDRLITMKLVAFRDKDRTVPTAHSPRCRKKTRAKTVTG